MCSGHAGFAAEFKLFLSKGPNPIVSRFFTTLCLLGLAACAAWTSLANPPRQAARNAGTARVVRVQVPPDGGRPTGSIRREPDSPGATNRSTSSSGRRRATRSSARPPTPRWLRSRRKGCAPSPSSTPSPPTKRRGAPATHGRSPSSSRRRRPSRCGSIIIDLERSRRGVWLADPELVLRRNRRFAAVLDAGAVADPGTDLVERYTRRGLVPAETLSVEESAALSTRYFPEDPYVAAEPGAVQKAEEGAIRPTRS